MTEEKSGIGPLESENMNFENENYKAVEVLVQKEELQSMDQIREDFCSEVKKMLKQSQDFKEDTHKHHIKEGSTITYVELDNDIYCFTFCAYLSQSKFSPIQLTALYRKCIMVFSLQILLTSFFFWQMNKDENIQMPNFA